jgi:23S rRNA (uracil1939-C5)-methyltransferase
MGSKKKKPLPLLEKVEITDLAAEGRALAKVNDFVVFVPWVAPGDVVDIQLTRKRSNYAEGHAIRFHNYATERVTPFCEHFTICGGCKWQHIPYETQLSYKQKQVTDSLTRIGKVEWDALLPIIGSEQTTFYRNKLEYTFSNKRWFTAGALDSFANNEPEAKVKNGAGFHIPGKFDKVLDIHTCWLQNDISNRIRLFIKDFCNKNQYSFFDLRALNGFIRTLIIRTATSGELMIIVVFFEDDKTKRETLLHAIRDKFPEITSLLYIINAKCNDTITDQEVIVFAGNDHLIEKMEDLQFKIGPKSFFQTNSLQAYRLYSIVRSFAGLTGSEIVYDLYTGTGTIANFIARKSKKVIGIEYVPEAIEDAKINAQLNQADNISFFTGDIKDKLTPEFFAEHGKPDVVITDPPRAGMHDHVIGALLAAEAKRIVYVSCNPATQARDLSRLSARYHIRKVQPVDMFPHTHHVENVVLLELKE